MSLVIITPVGPGHEKVVEAAKASVRLAVERRKSDVFGPISHMVVDDTKGELGRSRARNQGMVKADWYFFLDADDTMRSDALSLNDFNSPATFGAVSLSGCIYEKNVFPCGWPEIAKHGAAGTLCMGFFCRGDVARALRFNEEMDQGEDFDFYMRLPSFTKIERPLIDVGPHPSATGPRGYTQIDWVGICDKVIGDAIERDPSMFGVRGDAILAAAGHS